MSENDAKTTPETSLTSETSKTTSESSKSSGFQSSVFYVQIVENDASETSITSKTTLKRRPKRRKRRSKRPIFASKLSSESPTQVPQGVVLAQVGILIFQKFAYSRGRPSKLSEFSNSRHSVCSRGPANTAFTSVPSATPFHCVSALVPDRELAQACRPSSKKISLIFLASCSLARLKVSKKSCQKSVEQ